MAATPFREEIVREVLASFADPESGRSIVQMEQVHRLACEGDRLEVVLGLTTHSAPIWNETRDELLALLRGKFPDKTINVVVERHERKPEKLGEIGLTAKTVLAVGAGKGGVGKSSVAAYLAYGLARAGCAVGLMDADVYGPSIPHLLGTSERPVLVGDRIQPIVVDGLRVMSMGLLIPPGEPVAWRGPMLHKYLAQFLGDTAWGDLDYLVIDMPPGTGDVALSLSQLLPLSGAVVVCTPQQVALLDAVRAVGMFRKVNIEVHGMVENMSFFLCPNCSSRHELFGSGGARRAAAELQVPFLGELPLVPQLRQWADEGRIGKSFDDPTARPYLEAIVLRLVRNLAAKQRREPTLPPLNILH